MTRRLFVKADAERQIRAAKEWCYEHRSDGGSSSPLSSRSVRVLPFKSMSQFETKRLPADPTVTAPDGSDVRVLLGLSRGGMAHFQLAAGCVSVAVAHRTVEEIWFIVSGHGRMWRKQGEHEETVDLEPGHCLTIPLGTHFQFRAAESGPLAAIGVTMPPWPGDNEAVVVPGPWSPSE